MIPRVGEGYYTPMPKQTIEHWQMVQQVLREMRQVTSRLVINGEKK